MMVSQHGHLQATSMLLGPTINLKGVTKAAARHAKCSAYREHARTCNSGNRLAVAVPGN
jgi:hypothetical protein